MACPRLRPMAAASCCCLAALEDGHKTWVLGSHCRAHAQQCSPRAPTVVSLTDNLRADARRTGAGHQRKTNEERIALVRRPVARRCVPASPAREESTRGSRGRPATGGMRALARQTLLVYLIATYCWRRASRKTRESNFLSDRCDVADATATARAIFAIFTIFAINLHNLRPPSSSPSTRTCGHSA